MAFYETSNENGFFRIQFARIGLGALSAEGEGFENGWAVTHKDEVLARGRDAETAWQTAVTDGVAQRFRLPKKLLDWNYKRGY